MTTAANLNDLVPTEVIEQALGPHLPLPTALAMAWSKAVGKGSGNNVQIPRWNNIVVPAGTKVENDEFALVASTTDAENVSGGWVGLSDRVSWEANNHSVIDATAGVIAIAVAHIRNRVDADGLAELANAAVDGGTAGSATTDDMVLDANALFETQNPHDTPGGRGIVLTVGQLTDWVKDLKANGGEQIGADKESERIASLMGLRQGFRGVRNGLQVFVSNNVSITGDDANGAIFQMGAMGALAYRNWAPIEWESEWMPRRKAWEVTVATNYGWVLPDQNNLLGFVTLAVSV